MAKLDDLKCRELIRAQNWDALVRLVSPVVVKCLSRSMPFQLDEDEATAAVRVGVWRAALIFGPDGPATFLRFALLRAKSEFRSRGITTRSSIVALPREITALAIRRASRGEPCPANVSPVAWAIAANGTPAAAAEFDDATTRGGPPVDELIAAAQLRARVDRAIAVRFANRPHFIRPIQEWAVSGGPGADLAGPLRCTTQNAGIIGRHALEAVRLALTDYDIAPGWPKTFRTYERLG